MLIENEDLPDLILRSVTEPIDLFSLLDKVTGVEEDRPARDRAIGVIERLVSEGLLLQIAGQYCPVPQAPMTNQSTLKSICLELAELLPKKNAAYGNSFACAEEFLRLLYPDGIKPEQYGDVLLLVRIFDKQMRIATSKDAFGESPYLDIAGYGVLGASAKTSEPVKPTYGPDQGEHKCSGWEGPGIPCRYCEYVAHVRDSK